MSLYLLVCIRFSLYGDLSLDKLENKYMQTDRIKYKCIETCFNFTIMGCQKNKYWPSFFGFYKGTNKYLLIKRRGGLKRHTPLFP